MAFRKAKKVEEQPVHEKILDVDASMQGNLTFRDPVNLRINGRFEGNLDTKGNLAISDSAEVQAKIRGDSIVVAGKVQGEIVAYKELRLTSTALVVGIIETPILSVQDGAIFQGTCKMDATAAKALRSLMSAEELAQYLEVEVDSVLDWASAGKIPALREGNNWRFERNRIDEWLSSEKVK
jgi:excisionase family DNA binding protein